MGVFGLISYVEKNCGNTFQDVNIFQLGQLHRSHGQEPTILIDMACCLTHVYGNAHLDFICGGQLKEYLSEFLRFFDNLKKNSISYVVFSDGSPPINRKRIWMERRVKEYETIQKMFEFLQRGEFDLANDLRFRVPFMWHCLVPFMKFHKIKLKQTVKEADDEILEYAAQNGCLGVISQDSDYIIAPGIQHMFSIQHLNLNTMSTKSYRGDLLAQNNLNIHPSQLPLFATLCGNDVVQAEDLASFHRRDLSEYNPRNRHRLFPKVACWISRELKYIPENEIPNRVAHSIGVPSLADAIAKSIASYQPAPPSQSDCASSRKAKTNWEMILEVVKFKMTEEYWYSDLYSIVTSSKKFDSVCPQFYHDQVYPSFGKLLKPMRQRLYGILLKEKPKNEDTICVEEYIYHGPQHNWPEMVTPIFPDDHPGLMKIWLADNFPVERKFKLFCWAVSDNILPELLMNVPKPIQGPALAIYYLAHEVNSGLKQWELTALVVMTVVLMTITISQIKSIRIGKPNVTAIHISTVYQKACQMVYTVAEACGSPILPSEYPDFVIFDGRLFQLIYNDMKNGGTGANYYQSDPKTLEWYEKTMKFLFL